VRVPARTAHPTFRVLDNRASRPGFLAPSLDCASSVGQDDDVVVCKRAMDEFRPAVRSYSARPASRIPSPIGLSRLAQTRTGFTRGDPAPSDRHNGIRFHPIRTDRVKAAPETRASPSNLDLAQHPLGRP
jgi:hypothetical protein